MKILITGSAGFIGYSLCNYILSLNKKIRIVGIDNFNDYYDVKLKTNRIFLLKKFNKFKFYKIDINDNLKISLLFKKYKFDYVFNLAAQAGVRYSIDHPRKYIDTNIFGFYNILENCKNYKVKRLFYASSSSVYGENKKFPLKENYNINPKNIYALSKKINEDLTQIFNKFYKIKAIGLRFFTVYGEWGRPDMMMLKYIEAYYKKKTFQLNNHGKHSRDFTYIGDVVKILYLILVNSHKLNSHEILNICSNKPISLKKVISYMKKNNINPKIKKAPLQKADIIKTHGSNKKIMNITKFTKFTNFEESIDRTISWYKEYVINK